MLVQTRGRKPINLNSLSLRPDAFDLLAEPVRVLPHVALGENVLLPDLSLASVNGNIDPPSLDTVADVKHEKTGELDGRINNAIQLVLHPVAANTSVRFQSTLLELPPSDDPELGYTVAIFRKQMDARQASFTSTAGAPKKPKNIEDMQFDLEAVLKEVKNRCDGKNLVGSICTMNDMQDLPWEEGYQSSYKFIASRFSKIGDPVKAPVEVSINILAGAPQGAYAGPECGCTIGAKPDLRSALGLVLLAIFMIGTAATIRMRERARVKVKVKLK
jgi:hypothetical protein